MQLILPRICNNPVASEITSSSLKALPPLLVLHLPWINSFGLALNFFFRRSNQVDEIADLRDTMSADRELADEEEADDPRASCKKFVGEIGLPNCTLTCLLARCSMLTVMKS
jgi:hypothetical protein